MTEVGIAVTEPSLRGDVHRAAAAADRTVVDVSCEQPRSVWSSVRSLIIDGPGLAQLAAAGPLPKRPGVIAVGGDADDVDLRVAIDIGISRVLTLPAELADLTRALSLNADYGQASRSVAVLGGHGGAGASTFAAALTVVARNAGIEALTVDADALGGGLDLLLGLERTPGLRWHELALQGGQVSGEALVAALPRRVLSPGRGTAPEISVEAALAVLDAGQRCAGITVIDLPRRDDSLTRACLQTADTLVIVATATLRGCAATTALLSVLGAHNRDAGLVVRGPSPGGLTAKEVAGAVGLPLWASMRPQPRLDEELDRGGLRLAERSPLARAARTVLNRVNGE